MLRAPVTMANAANITPGTFKIESTVNPAEDFSSVASAADVAFGMKIAMSVALKKSRAPVTANGKM